MQNHPENHLSEETQTSQPGHNAHALLEDTANQNPPWHNGGHMGLTAGMPDVGVRVPAVGSSSRGTLSSWDLESLSSRVRWSRLLGCCP